jgi:hypothetical protein
MADTMADPMADTVPCRVVARSMLRVKKVTQSSMRCTGLSKIPMSSRSCLAPQNGGFSTMTWCKMVQNGAKKYQRILTNHEKS